MKSFIDHYRKFRNVLFEECGDMEEDNIILLYSLYLEHKNSVNPDDPDFDDDPFSSNTTGV